MILGHDSIYTRSYYRDVVEDSAKESAVKISNSIVNELAPKRVIDVGCGTGALLEALRDKREFRFDRNLHRHFSGKGNLLTYSSSFRSASGVLAVSSFFRVPCVGSGGDGPLKSDITKYKLGPWAHPDDLDTLVEALKLAVNSPPQPEWDLYESDHSWETNAKLVAETLLS